MLCASVQLCASALALPMSLPACVFTITWSPCYRACRNLCRLSPSSFCLQDCHNQYQRQMPGLLLLYNHCCSVLMPHEYSNEGSQQFCNCVVGRCVKGIGAMSSQPTRKPQQPTPGGCSTSLLESTNYRRLGPPQTP